MSCPDRESLSAYADGAVEAPQLAEIERHLSGCALCREFVLEMRRLNERGRASLQAIRVGARLEPASLRRTPSRARLVCVLSLAAAATLLVSLSALLVERRRNPPKPPATAAAQPPSEEEFAMPSDADFEAWAAPYRKLHIPLVPMEDVAKYKPQEMLPMSPETPLPRNHS